MLKVKQSTLDDLPHNEKLKVSDVHELALDIHDRAYRLLYSNPVEKTVYRGGHGLEQLDDDNLFQHKIERDCVILGEEYNVNPTLIALEEAKLELARLNEEQRDIIKVARHYVLLLQPLPDVEIGSELLDIHPESKKIILNIIHSMIKNHFSDDVTTDTDYVTATTRIVNDTYVGRLHKVFMHSYGPITLNTFTNLCREVVMRMIDENK